MFLGENTINVKRLKETNTITLPPWVPHKRLRHKHHDIFEFIKEIVSDHVIRAYVFGAYIFDGVSNLDILSMSMYAYVMNVCITFPSTVMLLL